MTSSRPDLPNLKGIFLSVGNPLKFADLSCGAQSVAFHTNFLVAFVSYRLDGGQLYMPLDRTKQLYRFSVLSSLKVLFYRAVKAHRVAGADLL